MTESTKKLWSWYALTLMPMVARKDWLWKEERNRCEKTFTECVVVGDEAFALSIIEQKGEEYMVEKMERKNNTYAPKGRGRRRKAGEENEKSEDGIGHRVGTYLKYRDLIVEMRSADPESKLGWNAYVYEIANEKMEGRRGTKRKGCPLKNGYKNIEIPMDITAV